MNSKPVKMLFVLIFFLVGGLCFAADLVEGFWISVDEKTGKDTAGWEIFVQNGKLYGKILSAVDAKPGDKATACKPSYKGHPTPGNVSEMPIIGTIFIFDLVPDSKGKWKGGNIINPEDGKMYGCEITYHAADGKKYTVDTLEVRGTGLAGLLGRSQYWRKATKTQAESLR
ncbi:MAG: DUF2147 domain-containing protein [Treponema sp.]|nr:DUF2147 domain-containing protein [Treponema sp.]